MKGLNGGGCIPRPTACLSAATWNTLRSSFERCTQTERISMAAKNDVGQARTLRQAMWHPCMYICICNYIACVCAQINSNQKIITYIYIWSGPQGQFALLWGASHIRSQNSQYAEMLQIWAIKNLYRSAPVHFLTFLALVHWGHPGIQYIRFHRLTVHLKARKKTWEN